MSPLISCLFAPCFLFCLCIQLPHFCVFCLHKTKVMFLLPKWPRAGVLWACVSLAGLREDPWPGAGPLSAPLWPMVACPWVGASSDRWSKFRVLFGQSLKKGLQ